MNRRLVHEMARIGGGRWEITAAAPSYFHGKNDLRPVHLERRGEEPSSLAPVNAYFTRRVHVFVYGWSLRALTAEPWDLVHCWEEPYVVAGGQVALWTPRKTALVFRSAQNINKRYPRPFSWIERFAVERASGWTCCGELVAETLLARPGYAARPHAKIPLGVDVGAFRPDAVAGANLRRELGWEEGGPPVVGYLGRFTREKGLEVLQRALDQVRTPWRALLVGDGEMLPQLRAWAEGHGDRVRICRGVVHDQVPRYLNAMDILCAPSQTTPGWREQFGRMVIEAFASGVPVVGSDSGEIPYVVGDSGMIVAEKDVPAWATAIGRLLEDPGQRAELAQRGLARAHAEYAWPKVAQRYIDFFESILN
jgi:glycosyltransferase involved in cell wall biosynthesis